MLLIAPRALSTISIACWAPFTVLTSRSLAYLAAGAAVEAVKVGAVAPVQVPGVAVMALNEPSALTLSLTEVRVTPAVPFTSANTPVSPILALIAVTSASREALPVAAASAPCLTETSAMATPLICRPLVLKSALVPGSARASALVSNLAPPRALALASMVLSMAMAWPALAPTWNSWLENEPSSSLVPLKSDCLATRSISETSWVTSACSALRSLAELVALEACTDSSRTRCRLLPISVSEPSATWASEMPSLALRMATSVPRICVPKRSEIARPAASSLALLMREPEDRRWMVVASELPLVLRLR